MIRPERNNRISHPLKFVKKSLAVGQNDFSFMSLNVPFCAKRKIKRFWLIRFCRFSASWHGFRPILRIADLRQGKSCSVEMLLLVM